MLLAELRGRLRLAAVAAAFLTASVVSAQDEQGFTKRERITRIRDLGKKDPGAIPALTAQLSDSDPDIRIEAVKAIVKLDTDASLKPLEKAAHDNEPEIQVRATDGLVNYYVPGYVAHGLSGPITRGVRGVRSFFSSRNDQAVAPGTVLQPGVSDALSFLIKGGASTDVRANAALAAGILRAQACLPALEQAARSKNSDLIFESLIAFQKIGDPSAGSSVSFLTNDLDSRIQLTALETVGILRSEPAAPDVSRALQSARNEKVRWEAMHTLSVLARPADRATFVQYLHDGNPDVRVSALEALARLRDPADTPALTQIFNEPNAGQRVHLAAAFALVNGGNVDTSEFSALRYLFQTLESKDDGEVAQNYLTETCARPEVRTALYTFAPSATKDQKLKICHVLGSSGSSDSLPVLQKMAKDIDPDVVLAASRALEKVKARQS